MNKSLSIGIVVIVIVIISGIVYSLSSTESDEKNLSIIEDIDLDDLTSVEEGTVSIPEQTGREFSVEFTEKIGLKSP